MNDKDKIRLNVSEFYARSVRSKSGCCCGGPTLPKGIAATMAGYQVTPGPSLPKEALESSFGCGNPLAMAGVKEGQTVLDLGSGAGLDLLIASRQVGASGRVIGVDMTDEMITRAQKVVKDAGATNAEVRKGFIEQLPVEDSSVDWVISNCVINLSPDKPQVFSEIVRVLRPGGRISVSDIVVRDLPEWVRASSPLYASCIGGAISEGEYASALTAAGLVEVEVVDRLVYDQEQIAALVGAPGAAKKSCCGGSSGALNASSEDVRDLAGRVWSAKFSARKPTE